MKKNYIALLMAAVIMGSTFPIQKLGLINISPLQYIIFRFGIASLISFFIFGYGKFLESFFLGLVLSFSYITQIIGLTYTTSSKSGFIVSQYVVLVPIFSYFLEREKISKNQLISFLLSIVGSYLLTGGIAGFNFGDMLMFLCAIGFSLHIVLITKFSKVVEEKKLLFFQFFTVTIISVFLSFVFKIKYVFNFTSLNSILYVGTIGTVLVIFLQLKYQKKVGSNLTVLLFLAQPIVSSFLSILILHEEFTIIQVFGAFLLMLAVVISTLKLSQKNV
ncbi:membrane protein [Tepiditoga spiralis]|uniref:Membrane protein n=1 Tax=Tepiditoga spiralis TaxID=2108365 RepID=A0A7G1G9P9_9BACT|nr:DMT family transporter [Tepiditoga spiralis]BBE31713.1 membrane protein [Tepiditoga spiralis]